MTEHVPYQVLARKYRPRAFDEVVGQPGVVMTLRNAIEQQRLHHAYLFSGTRGVGKTTLARLFSRALNCANGPTTEPCGTCNPCVEIAAGSSMDVIEIDGASNRKVEDVDPLREAARYAPARDRHKIFIIDEVHMLSETAFNALLKVLEEPPPRTLFLFATTEPEEVPDTIMSRCLHLACRRVSRQEIAAALARTAKAEEIEGTPEAFDLIAGLAAGSMRDGLSLLDQAIAFSGGAVDGETVRTALGLIDRGIVRDFIEAIGRQDAPGVLAVIERLSEAGADLTHFSREALSRVRDVMVTRAAGAAAARDLGLGEDEAAECETLAKLFSTDGLLRLMQAMLDLADRIRREEHPRFLLEAAALRMIRLANLTPIEDLVKALGSGATAPPRRGATRPEPGPKGGRRAAAGTEPPPITEPPAATTPADEPTAQPARKRELERILARISERKVSLATFLSQARGMRLEGDTVVVTMVEKQGFLRSALESADNVSLIEEEASAVFSRPATLRLEFEAPASDDLASIADAETGNEASRKHDRLINEALKEPVVRTVMDMFKGRIVDIREGQSRRWSTSTS